MAPYGYTTSTWTNASGAFSGTFFRIRFSALPPPVLRPRVCAHWLFGLSCDAPRRDVRRAYRRLAKIAHPDLAPPERKAELGRWMSILNTAYEVLETGVAT